MSTAASVARSSIEWHRVPGFTASPARGPIGVALAIVGFAGLGAFCMLHWARLVADPPVVRVLAAVLVAAGGGSALAATRRLRGGRAWAIRASVAVVTLAAALVVAGLPARLLLPTGWSELAQGLELGFAGLRTVRWPYAGSDEWVRLTILLAIPPALTLAAMLAFWPAGRAREPLRALGLVLLVALYGVAIAEHEAGAQIARGSLLFGLMAAWLLLPRLGRGDALAAGGALVAVALVAVPLAARLDHAEPWIKYGSWHWLGQVKRVSYDWNHSYGPIEWPRDGDVLLTVKSRRAHYWRAATLGHFDGVRWTATPGMSAGTPGLELPVPADPRWTQKARVSVGALSSGFLVAPGAVQSAVGTGPLLRSGDGTARLTADPLEQGDTYTVRSYAPDPSAAEMRAAPDTVPAVIRRYTTIDLPRADAASGSIGLAAPLPDGRTIALPGPGGAGPGAPEARRAVLASPYARAYELARRLAASAPTTYNAVKRIETHLRENYDYSERPPERAYPLAAFLSKDRIGYCQQFSGAMALMLRMNGIPARVASGFTPGVANEDTASFTVRDRDAHSWVEVYFQGIGWVPFDPTPSTAPAESQSGGSAGPSAARGDPGERRSESVASLGPDPRQAPGRDGGADGGDDPAGASPAGPAEAGRGGGGLPWIALGGLAALAALALGAAGLARRRFAAGYPDAALNELHSALARLGHPVPAGMTLAGLERQLELSAGAGAARYVRRLREHRFGGAGRPGPALSARRELRRALTSGAGPLALLRGYLALPPRPRGPFQRPI